MKLTDALPNIWLGLLPPYDPSEAEPLVRAAIDSRRPIDISSAPARWGGLMRSTDALLTTFGGREIENATDPAHATNLLNAELVQTLSSIGRDYIDLFFLTVRRHLEEHQIEGALTAMRSAKSEGAIRNIGLFVECEVQKELLTNGCFDVLIAPDNLVQSTIREELEPFAKQSGTPLASCRLLNWGDGDAFTEDTDLVSSVIANKARNNTVIIGVRSVQEIVQAMQSETKQPDPDFEERLKDAAVDYTARRAVHV